MRALAGAFVVAAALLLAACGGSEVPGPTSSLPPTSSSQSPSDLPSQTPTTAAPTDFAPLTGVPVTSAAAANRSVVAVCVGLTPGVGTTGVGAADVVYQEFDRPGQSRLVVLFQSTDAPSIGPVSSTAPVDMRLLFLLAKPVYAYNGGSTGFVAEAQAGPVTPRGAGLFGALFRGGASGLVTSSAVLRATVRGASPPPSGTLTFASDGTPMPTAGPALHRIVITAPGQAAETFTWTGKAWAGPAGVLVSNVIVQVVSYKSITPHKAPTVGSAQVIGSGGAAIYARNHGVNVSWSRLQPGFVTSYRIGINPVGLAPGRTWIVLAPTGTRVTAS